MCTEIWNCNGKVLKMIILIFMQRNKIKMKMKMKCDKMCKFRRKFHHSQNHTVD